MTRAACTTQPQELLEYWLGELDAAAEQRLDEHLFACAACTEKLRALVELGAGIRGELLRGTLAFVLPALFIDRLKAAGLRVREYALDPGGSVDCTVTPDDDLVVSILRAPLEGVRRLDVLIDDSTTGSHRAVDVAFDPAAGRLAVVPSTAHLRTLRHAQQRVRLVAVDGADEREIADYTFNHYPS
jgi:hypothetical protein